MDFSGFEIDRYHIIEKLGQGGMAVVYKAFDTKLERYVAIKIVRTDIYGPAIRERVNQRFEREAKTLSKLEHPNIIAIIDYGYWEESPYLVMPFIPGGTLKDKLGKPIYWREAIQLLMPIVDALVYAHSKGLIHRDVKPSNILISETGLPLLTDFGIAKVLEMEEGQLTLTATGVGMGTPEYMAPEQGLGKPVDGRADVYSLAVVLYEMITGNKPFSADTPLAVLMMHVNDPIPSTRKYNVRIPESLERVLYKALAKDAENRYQSMAEFGKALQGVLAEYGERPEPKPWVNEAAPIAVAVEKSEEPKPKPQASQQRKSSTKPAGTPKPVISKEKQGEKKITRLPVIPLIAVLVVLAAAGGWYGINQGRNGNANRTPTAIIFSGAALGSETMTATPSPTSTEFDAGLAFLAETPTETATLTSTFTSTFRPTSTKTPLPTATKTQAPPSRTSTKTNTFTPSRTYTVTNTFTPSRTYTVTRTFTSSPTFTRYWTVTSTPTPTNTRTPTNTPAPTNTRTSPPTNTPTNTLIPIETTEPPGTTEPPHALTPIPTNP